MTIERAIDTLEKLCRPKAEPPSAEMMLASCALAELREVRQRCMKAADEYAEDATAKMHDALIGVADEEYSAAIVLALVGVGRAVLAQVAATLEAARLANPPEVVA